MPNVADAVAEAAAEMVAEESADRRRAEEAVSAAAAAAGGAQLAGSGLGVGHHGFTRDFGHTEYQGAAGAAERRRYGPPRYVQGYPQGFAYHSFPQPTAHPHGAHQSNHQRTSGTGSGTHAPPRPSVQTRTRTPPHSCTRNSGPIARRRRRRRFTRIPIG